MNNNIYSVTEINVIIRNLLTDSIGKVSVTGEVSNLKYHSSGHIYFSLKDSKNSVIRCVMFKFYTKNLKIKLNNGNQITVSGNIDTYIAGGYYQIKVTSIEVSGEGDLLKKFEELKLKLKDEGLFDETKKKKLPKYPKTIGIITSETGAAVQDIIRVIKTRYPITELLLYPADVQGDKAKFDIVKGLEYFNENNNVDVIISGRGGGSMEDLWAFNEEIVARAIYKSKIPVISAVGHEIDFTISDFVADVRAATPSAAAEIAVPDINELFNNIKNMNLSVHNNIIKLFRFKEIELKRLKENRYLTNPYLILEDKIQRVDLQKEYMIKSINNIYNNKLSYFNKLKDSYVLKNIHYQLEHRKEKLETIISNLKRNYNLTVSNKKNNYEHIIINLIKNYQLTILNKKNLLKNNYDKLRMLSPLNILNRGYSIVSHKNKIIKESNQLKTNDVVSIKFAKGSVKSTIKKVE